jgi:subtilisin family serine protease
MVTYRYGGAQGRRHTLTLNEELLVVRTHSRRPVHAVMQSQSAHQALHDLEPVLRFHYAGVDVFRYRPKARMASTRRAIRTALSKEKDTKFAGRVLAHPVSKRPVLYTENLFVKFEDDAAASLCRKVLKEFGLHIKQELEYCRNGYFVDATEGTGRKVFSIADRVLKHDRVELCHPELVQRRRWKAAAAEQWHLKKTTISGRLYDAHASVEAAWAFGQGESITVAVIDDGVDLAHEEFQGSGKIVFPRDVSRGTNDPRPGNGDDHGTACAGVACASGLHRASGVAPQAKLMPIRLNSALGSQREADAFVWAASHGADVISCSWGPEDGDWSNTRDPLHRVHVPLPDSTRLAIDWAIAHGRNGKGCVITWAAGNGNESVDNDGYASYEKVIAVAACNARGQRSVYSDYGKAVWCAFPSNDFREPPVPGIWTTDRSGAAGYNAGVAQLGDAAGNYTNDFGGTSSACPGVAGVAALMLARNPGLRWDEVKGLLQRSCDRIDQTGGNYDSTGHSPLYGYGRLNALKAVQLARPAATVSTVVHAVSGNVAIRDLKTSRLSVMVAEATLIATVKIAVDIEHTYIGDLVVQIVPPSSSRIGPITLHRMTGRGMANLKKTYDLTTTPELKRCVGKSPQGKWTLKVQDVAKDDTGKILRFAVELGF